MVVATAGPRLNQPPLVAHLMHRSTFDETTNLAAFALLHLPAIASAKTGSSRGTKPRKPHFVSHFFRPPDDLKPRNSPIMTRLFETAPYSSSFRFRRFVPIHKNFETKLFQPHLRRSPALRPAGNSQIHYVPELPTFERFRTLTRNAQLCPNSHPGDNPGRV